MKILIERKEKPCGLWNFSHRTLWGKPSSLTLYVFVNLLKDQHLDYRSANVIRGHLNNDVWKRDTECDVVTSQSEQSFPENPWTINDLVARDAQRQIHGQQI